MSAHKLPGYWQNRLIRALNRPAMPINSLRNVGRLPISLVWAYGLMNRLDDAGYVIRVRANSVRRRIGWTLTAKGVRYRDLLLHHRNFSKYFSLAA